MTNVKVVVVGDTGVGKTTFIYTYINEEFRPNCHLFVTLMDTGNLNVIVGDRCVSLSLWDTVGNTEYDGLRPLAYPKTDCFVLCFALNNRPSFDNIPNKFYPELHLHCPNSPVILTGTKMDLRSGNEDRKAQSKCIDMISYKEGIELANEIKAVTYIECSAKYLQGVNIVIDEAIRTVLTPMKGGQKKTESCIAL